MIKSLIVTMRPKHWIKNLFVFIPLLVSGSYLNLFLLKESLFAFLSFCLASSIVYFINDFIDIEKDKNHPVKKFRPIASGKINSLTILFFVLLMLLGLILIEMISINNTYIIISTYLVLNLNYSIWIKKLIIWDVICVSLGFVLRVQGGVLATNLETSPWLISMTFTLAMFLILSKRSSELKKSYSTKTRDSLRGYTLSSIKHMQNIFISCTLIFYLLYVNLNQTFSGRIEFLYISSIFVIAGLMRFIQISSLESELEDPTNLLYKDKVIMLSVILWGILIGLSHY